MFKLFILVLVYFINCKLNLLGGYKPYVGCLLAAVRHLCVNNLSKVITRLNSVNQTEIEQQLSCTRGQLDITRPSRPQDIQEYLISCDLTFSIFCSSVT